MYHSKTNIYYKDGFGTLRSLSYDDAESDIEAVQDQGAIVADIIDLGMTTPTSVVLCAVESIRK